MSPLKYEVDIRRSRTEVATVTVDATDAADARMKVDGMIAKGELPRKTSWQEESVGAPMIGSPRRAEG